MSLRLGGLQLFRSVVAVWVWCGSALEVGDFDIRGVIFHDFIREGLERKELDSERFSLWQALLYRLSGDYNALHSDPIIAKVAGFSQPILHGLCTLGFAVRAIIKCICRGDQDLIKSIAGRFLLHVYPGETLVTEMWLEGLRVIYRTKAKERKRTVLSGYVDLRGLTSSL
ncbi:hypothetical protein ACSQ67_018045 [Phaseolus vulgaris]